MGDETDRAAVRLGSPPLEEGDRDVPRGRWSYHPNGYFLRYFPTGYSRTEVQIYVPEPVSFQTDDDGRIVTRSPGSWTGGHWPPIPRSLSRIESISGTGFWWASSGRSEETQHCLQVRRQNQNLMLNSKRRFAARPAAVPLSAMGWAGPYPTAVKRALSRPFPTK